MIRAIIAAGVVSLLVNWMPTPALAFDCSKAYLAVDFVICSSPAVTELADKLQKTYESAINDDDADEDPETLKSSERTWAKTFGSECGLAYKGQPPREQLTKAYPCVIKEITERIAYLEHLENGALATSRATASETPNSEVSNSRQSGAMEHGARPSDAGTTVIKLACTAQAYSCSPGMEAVCSGPPEEDLVTVDTANHTVLLNGNPQQVTQFDNDFITFHAVTEPNLAEIQRQQASEREKCSDKCYPAWKQCMDVRQNSVDKCTGDHFLEEVGECAKRQRHLDRCDTEYNVDLCRSRCSTNNTDTPTPFWEHYFINRATGRFGFSTASNQGKGECHVVHNIF